MTRRGVVLALAVTAAAVVGVAGTGGVASTAVERDASIAVADGEPYLDVTVDAGRTDDPVTIHVENRLPVTVTVQAWTGTRSGGGAAQTTVGSGMNESVDLSEDACGEQVTVRAEEPDVTVELDRTVDCEPT